ncbi:MAG: PDZ domain-containing protein [Vallitaleaceae bacterium]|nr:PDZ domain-containing protein [Vallitaleaceae bacterium]
MFDLFSISLIGVAQSVFSYMFVMLVWILYMLVKKLGLANVYNRDQSRTTFASMIELAMHGTIAGFILSLVLILIGIPITMSPYLLLLIPISLILGMGNIRYLCMSYSMGVLGLMAMIFNGQNLGSVTLPNIDIEVSGLIALAGALHVIEGVLVALYGDRDAIPIVSKKGDQILLGHIIQRYWPIPFAALIATTGAFTGGTVEMPNWWPFIGQSSFIVDSMIFMPLSMLGILGYSTVTFVQSPKKRVVGSGIGISIYGIVLIGLGLISQNNMVLEIIGIVSMVGLHELIIAVELFYENNTEPIYPLPEKGIRIMHVNEGSIAEYMGLVKGDLIENINGIEVVNLRHFKAIMKQKYNAIKIQVVDITSRSKELNYTSTKKTIEALGIKLIPENPVVLFKASNMMKIGMIHLMRNRNMKK